ncbi:hypothetical protein [Streptomyces coeruleorubidus]|uniref:hypothetical protein n=1 Tax=Streptomyces coeruleorubidus TaxID=116188 RepID=UPI00379EEF2F
MRWSADASGEGLGGVLLVGVPVAALAADVAGAGARPQQQAGDGFGQGKRLGRIGGPLGR